MRLSVLINRGRSWGLPYLLGSLGIHVLGIGLLFSSGAVAPTFIAMAFLAYTLGLRHAFDADHLAAIDNAVRTAGQVGRKALGAGFAFSAGHSTVVLAIAIIVSLASGWFITQFPAWQEWGHLIGPLVSGLFLLGIGLLNLWLCRQLWRSLRELRTNPDSVNLQNLNLPGGPLFRLMRPLIGVISSNWKLYFLGILFGLGFDTASEISLLALSAHAATQALSWQFILSLPVLFAAGMTLLDTTDGILMTKAYNWASINPLRKLGYNLSLTGLSVMAALVLGTIEVLQILSAQFGWESGIWEVVQSIDFGTLGLILAGLLIATWLCFRLIFLRRSNVTKDE